MSCQSGHSSSHQEEEGLPSSSTGMAPTTFHSFRDLPRELQIMVWEWAFWTGGSRRLACLRIHSTPSARLSQQVLNLDNRQARIGWPLSNPFYLEETDHVARLLATSFLSRTIAQQLFRETSRTTWLQRVGLSDHHINPHSDIVFLGSNGNLLTDNALMMAVSLVLGSTFTSIMVPANSFSSLCSDLLQSGFVEPVSAALNILRAVDPIWDEIFRPGPDNLRPDLSKNMYFLLGPLPNTDLCSHGPGCIHLGHLEIFDLWNPELGLPDVERFLPCRDDIIAVAQIEMFWFRLGILPGFRGKIPKTFLAKFSTHGGAE